MKREVYIAARGLVCAAGTHSASVADALWANRAPAGDTAAAYRRLPLPDADWRRRADAALALMLGELGPLSPELPLFVASSSFQIGHFEQAGTAAELPLPCASFAQQIAERLGLSGTPHCFGNACVAGYSALQAATTGIALGWFDEALVLGVELDNRSTPAGFTGLGLLSPTACRPFDRQRDGLVLGEAVAAVRLSHRPAGWRLAGVVDGLDAHSMTGPTPDGQPIAALLSAALHAARLSAGDIGLIKAHAAGSPGSDLAEARALHQVFGPSQPHLCSLKGALGHTLGASGIAELAAVLACLEAGRLPPTHGFVDADPELGLVPSPAATARIDHALLCGIGFGGGLGALIVARP